MRLLDFADDEIDTHRKAYHFLRSAITPDVDRDILLYARSPTEAWRNLKKGHYPGHAFAVDTLGRCNPSPT